MPKSAFAANAQAKVCAAAVARLLAGGTPRRTEADQHLLQPGRAGLRHLGRRRLPAGQRPARPTSRAPAASARSTRRPRSVPRKRIRRCLVQDDHRPRRSADALARPLLLAMPLCASRGRATSMRCDGTADRRAGRPGARQAIVENRQLSACLLCHSGPFPEPHLQGTLGPTLDGVGSRLTAGQLRLRLVDAEKLNPDTIMPPYYRVDGLNRVGSAWQGKPVLSAAADRGRRGLPGHAARRHDDRDAASWCWRGAGLLAAAGARCARRVPRRRRSQR